MNFSLLGLPFDISLYIRTFLTRTDNVLLSQTGRAFYHPETWECKPLRQEAVLSIPILLHLLNGDLKPEWIMVHIARTGNLENLKMAQERGATISKKVMHEALVLGDMEIIEWCNGMVPLDPTDPTLMVSAAEGGHVDTLEWLLGRGCNITVAVSAVAAGAGHLHTVQWIWSMETEEIDYITEASCFAAARGGHLEILRWLDFIGLEMESDLYSAAAEGGHPQVMEWLFSKDVAWDPDACYRAVYEDHIPVVRWVRSKGIPVADSLCTTAAMRGSAAMLAELVAGGAQWDASVTRHAIETGNMDILRMRPPMDESIFLASAIKGDKDILEWLWNNDAPRSGDVCATAAGRGNLEALKWFISHGAPVDQDCYEAAKQNNKQDILDWLIKGCHVDWSDHEEEASN